VAAPPSFPSSADAEDGNEVDAEARPPDGSGNFVHACFPEASPSVQAARRSLSATCSGDAGSSRS
jgi:hypothetical protein